MFRTVLILSVTVLLSACVARGVMSVVPADPASGAAMQSVYVATNRNLSKDNTTGLFQQHFGESRASKLRFARVDISIPPGHEVGQIEWPNGKNPDPAQHFVTSNVDKYEDVQGFLRAMGPGEVQLFVHGYNVNNAEAVYRLAQIAHDFETTGPVIAYSWPSAGKAGGYVYDRDSVIFSRDSLENLLTVLSEDNRRIMVVAHSMGSQLVMETFRQMSIAGRTDVLDQVSGVALLSPDIDEDVFLQQARRIKPLPQPFLLLVSTRDRVLNLSAYLTGKPNRLGSIRDPEELGDLPVQVIDLSDLKGGDRTGHTTAFTSPAAIALLRGMSESLNTAP